MRSRTGYQFEHRSALLLCAPGTGRLLYCVNWVLLHFQGRQ